MEMTKETRLLQNDISRAIASLCPDASADTVVQLLDPLLAKAKSGDLQPSRTAESCDDDDVTPLMVCCDKAQSACLDYLCRALCESAGTDGSPVAALLGLPLDTGSIELGGNAALHHGAMTGFAAALPLLSTILVAYQTEEHEERGLLQLISQCNANGDTPIMMAAAAGHADLLHKWIELLVDPLPAASTPRSQLVTQNDVKRIIQSKNKTGDDALSLALGRGHFNVVKTLVQEKEEDDENWFTIGPVTHDDLTRCRSILEQMDKSFGRLPPEQQSNLQNEYKVRREGVQKCMELIEMEATRAAQNAMDLLLDLSASEYVKNITPVAKVGRKKNKGSKDKKKKQSELVAASGNQSPFTQTPNDHSSKHDKLSQTADSKASKSVWKKGNNKDIFEKEKNTSAPRFVTLADGTVISSKGVLHETDHLLDDDSIRTIGMKTDAITVDDDNVDRATLSMDRMLRERYQEPLGRSSTKNGSSKQNMSTSGNGGDETMKMEAVLDSLCLDPSMLLLTPHGMAMKLSPSQLDAIDNVLIIQMDAVKEARQIQRRLLSQATHEDTT
eukprot:scaffold221318_cov52-Attheya_sp.AAC.2